MSRGYCLKWNKFNTIFQNSFGGLYANQELTDVTFFCEGQFIKCHRLVISAASQYFRDIFVKLPEPNPVVVLSDVKYNVFKALIDFIYCGEIQVHQDLLEAVVKAGEKFRVKGLNEGDDQNSFPSHTVELSDTDFDVQSSAKKRRFDEATTPTRRSKWGGVSPRIHLNEEVFVPEKLQQPITVNAKLGSRSDVKQELFESIATNEDSFLREAESADFDTYDDTALDDDYEQGEVELEQPDFTLMTGSEDQDQTTTFGLGVEPQCVAVEKGAKFTSFQQMQLSIDAYCKDEGIKVFRKDSKTLVKALSEKKIEKKALRCDPDLLYYKLELCCVQGGRKYISRGTGERTPSTIRLDCPFNMKIGPSTDGKFLEIYSFRNQHNHQKGVLERISFGKPSRGGTKEEDEYEEATV